MSVETQSHQKSRTSGQEGFARLLTREGRANRQLGDRFKSMVVNASIGAAAAGGEIGEAIVFNKVLDMVMPTGTHAEKVKNKKGVEKSTDVSNLASPERSAVEFIEEWGSDKAIESIGNAVVQTLTGTEEEYVRPVSAFLSDWSNTIVQVFYPNKMLFMVGDKKTGFAVKTKDVINPVLVEAAFRVLSELPGGASLDRVLNTVSEKLANSTALRYASGVASQGILGYHIQKTILKESGKSSHPPAKKK